MTQGNLSPAAAAAVRAAEHLASEGWSVDSTTTMAPRAEVVMRVLARRDGESVALSVADPEVERGALQVYVAGSPVHQLVRDISGRHLAELALLGPHDALSHAELGVVRAGLDELAAAAGSHHVADRCAELNTAIEPEPLESRALIKMAEQLAGGAPISWVLSGS